LCSLILILAPTQHASAQDAPLSPQAQQILDAVNQARIDNGLPALAISPLLNLAAQRHVDDIVANGNWGHYGSDGSNVRLRASRVGYSTSSVSENWVAVSDPGQAIGWWMNDWIHRVNILEPRWDEVGVGAAQASNGFWILVTDFGNIDGGAMPPIVEATSVTQLTAVGDISVESIPADGQYSIQGGDTLLGIAYRFGLDWQDIALTNDMDEDDLLQIGDVIRLPIPNGTGGAVEAASAGVVAGKQIHVVRTGETLWTISARYQITWQDIAAVNGLGEYDLLQIGDELKLPASLDEAEESEAEAAETDEGAESAEEETSSDEEQSDGGDASDESSQAAEDVATDSAEDVTEDPSDEGARFVQANAPRTEQADTGERYTVESGDTLLAIAYKLDIEWEELAAANDLDEDSFLQIGQELKVPGGEPQLMSAKAQETSGTGSSGTGSSGTGSSGTDDTQSDSGSFVQALAGSGTRVHRVQAGDTVYGIALQYGIDWQDLLRANNLDEDSLLQLDQELLLP
jgi:LysM repeat protein